MIPSLLLPRPLKWVGLCIYIATIGYTFYSHCSTGLELNDYSNPTSFWIQFLVFMSLFMMISAKFKYEDERTSVIRLVSFQWAVALFMFAQLVSLGLCFYHQSGSYRPRYGLNLMLLVSLIMLYSQVYFLPFIKNKLFKNEE